MNFFKKSQEYLYAKNFTKKNTEKPCSQLASLSISPQNFQKKKSDFGYPNQYR